MSLRLANRDARRLWLDAQCLSSTPVGRLELPALVQRLGFVQLDTIQVLSRAHHHILWSRNQNYREVMLDHCLGKQRLVFEHFTHDASVLPVEFYPMWQRQFRRMGERRKTAWRERLPDESEIDAIKRRIADEGPLCTHDFEPADGDKREMWQRPPHKLALDYMWYAGELATAHRRNFTKFYDLAENVIPAVWREQEIADEAQIDWLCRAAMDRLAFGTPGDIQRFWDAASRAEVGSWLSRNAEEFVPVEVETADRSTYEALAAPDIAERLQQAPAPTSRLRILNPFDPVIRDRARLERLFGFDYRIEIFVPAAKRQWGYYVYPLLEGDRFVGRLEARADRRAGRLHVVNLWPEPGVKWTTARGDKLDAELDRMARFVGVTDVVWET